MFINDIFWIIVHIICILVLIFQQRLDDVAMLLNIIAIVLYSILAIAERILTKK